MSEEKLKLPLRTWCFTFAHPLRAKLFVEKLVKEVRDVAAFRDGAEVRVFDQHGDKLAQMGVPEKGRRDADSRKPDRLPRKLSQFVQRRHSERRVASKMVRPGGAK